MPFAVNWMQSNPKLTAVAAQEHGWDGRDWGANTCALYVTWNRSAEVMQMCVDRNPATVDTMRGDQQAFQDIFHWRWWPHKEFQYVDNPAKPHRPIRLIVTVEFGLVMRRAYCCTFQA